MLEADALIDWHRLRVHLREDLGSARGRGHLSPGMRLAAWTLFAAGWSMVGFPLVAMVAILIFEAYVVPGLSRPERRMGRTVTWVPPPSFVISPEAPPPGNPHR
jgi:hypothetical protein